MPRTATEEAQCNESCALGHSELDLESEQLRHETGRPLRPKSFAVLRYLAEHPGRLITKDELLEAVWSGVVLSESVLAVCLSELRKALEIWRKARGTSRRRPGEGHRHRRDRQTRASAERAARRRAFRAADAADRGPTDRTGSAARLVGRSAARRATDRLRDRGARHRQVDGGRRLRRPGLRRRRDVERAGPVHRTLRRRRALPLGPGRAGAAVPGRARRTVRAVARPSAPTWLGRCPGSSAPPSRLALERRARGSARGRTSRELREAVEALSRERPLLLLLGDLHWSDGATVDLLARLRPTPGGRTAHSSSGAIVRWTRSRAGTRRGPPRGTGEAPVRRAGRGAADRPPTSPSTCSAQLPPDLAGATSLKSGSAIYRRGMVIPCSWSRWWTTF